MKLRWELAVKIAGIIGGADYRRTYLQVARLAEERLDSVSLEPTLEEKCIWYLTDSHLTPSINEKMDTLLGIHMIWRYQ